MLSSLGQRAHQCYTLITKLKRSKRTSSWPQIDLVIVIVNYNNSNSVSMFRLCHSSHSGSQSVPKRTHHMTILNFRNLHARFKSAALLRSSQGGTVWNADIANAYRYVFKFSQNSTSLNPCVWRVSGRNENRTIQERWEISKKRNSGQRRGRVTNCQWMTLSTNKATVPACNPVPTATIPKIRQS